MDKRQLIIDAAIAVLQEKGMEKTKISDIVKAAGIAQGTFYLYFPSKLSVMPAIAEVMVRNILVRLNAVDDGGSAREQLDGMVEAIFEVTEQHQDLSALIYSGITQTEHVREWEAIYDPIYSWINGRLLQFRQRGEIRPSIAAGYAAKLVLGLIETAAEQNYLYASSDNAVVEAHVAELKAFLAAGLGVK
ncbi:MULTISPECIES: TetR family transcriptional regulator [unclassified Paenibacillus]|uniref:TetR family transcriptional regulator n=1 Tax=unclassified Paenibacillus TaxID=185978 RepID=UPI0009712873|nr:MULTISPECIES: TetR family transcriptional regulator [unclassified Paenibacillus]ASS66678.1 TetR/AcrR family transcriptional regulator [Paenibacillus sp. RUD330]